MEKYKKKSLPDPERIGEAIFCIAFALHISMVMLTFVKTGTVLIWSKRMLRYYLRISTYILLVVKFFFFQKTDWPRRLIALALCILGYVTWKESGSAEFYWTVIFLAAGKDVHVKNLAKTTLLVLVPGFIVTAVCAHLGLVEVLISVRASTGATRNAMGFAHYNTCGLYVFQICLAACAVRFGKRPTWEILLAGAGAVFCWVVPNSRTFAYATVLLAIFVCMFYYVRSRTAQRFLTVCMAGSTLFIIVFSYYCMLYYTDANPILARLDNIFSLRLSLSHQFYTDYGVTLLGQDYSDAPIIHDNVRFLVDNSFCNVLLLFGIFAGAIFLIIIAVFYTDAILNRRWCLCLMGFTLLMIVGFFESKGYRFSTNYFMIAVSDIFYSTTTEPERCGRRK